jgi:hypothetical protein
VKLEPGENKDIEVLLDNEFTAPPAPPPAKKATGKPHGGTRKTQPDNHGHGPPVDDGHKANPYR